MSSELGLDNLKLLETGELADVEIRCKDRVWKAHKVLLVARSPWFKRALTGNWKEAISGKIDVSESDPSTIDAVLRYIYIGDLGFAVEEGNLCFEICSQQWIQADYFQLDKMKEDILTCLRSNFVETASGLWTYERRGPQIAFLGFWLEDIDNWKDFSDDLLKATKLAYTVPGARELQKLLTVCVFGLGAAIGEEEDDLYALLDKSPEFKKDMFAALVGMRFSRTYKKKMKTSIHSVLRNESNKDRVCRTCRSNVERKYVGNVTLDTFSTGNMSWCDKCAKGGLEAQIEHMVDLL